MFYECKTMTELDLSRFDTGNVTTVRSMFHDCTGMTVLKLGEQFRALGYRANLTINSAG